MSKAHQLEFGKQELMNKIKKWWNKPKEIISQFHNGLEAGKKEGYERGVADSEDSMSKLRTYYLGEITKLKNDEAKSWLVDPEFVFSVSKAGNALLNGDQITTAELRNLKAEVHALKEFQIYKILQNTLRQKALEKAVLTSTDLYSLKGNEQVLSGKMMVWNLDVLKTIVNSIDKAKIK